MIWKKAHAPGPKAMFCPKARGVLFPINSGLVDRFPPTQTLQQLQGSIITPLELLNVINIPTVWCLAWMILDMRINQYRHIANYLHWQLYTKLFFTDVDIFMDHIDFRKCEIPLESICLGSASQFPAWNCLE